MQFSRKIIHLLVPTALTALGLASMPAYAQLYLSNDDSVTVDATGTHGRYAGGTLRNSRFSCTNGQEDNVIRIDDKSSFTLGTGGILTGVVRGPYGSHGLQTTGGTVMITGGTITAAGNYYCGLRAGGGRVTITGGKITGGPGGSGVVAYAGGVVKVKGGTITGGSGGFLPGKKGGNGLLIGNKGIVLVIGGSINGGIGATGMVIEDGGCLFLVSQGKTNFFVDGGPLNNVNLIMDVPGPHKITGVLLNGDKIDTTFETTGKGGAFVLCAGELYHPKD